MSQFSDALVFNVRISHLKQPTGWLVDHCSDTFVLRITVNLRKFYRRAAEALHGFLRFISRNWRSTGPPQDTTTTPQKKIDTPRKTNELIPKNDGTWKMYLLSNITIFGSYVRFQGVYSEDKN